MSAMKKLLQPVFGPIDAPVQLAEDTSMAFDVRAAGNEMKIFFGVQTIASGGYGCASRFS